MEITRNRPVQMRVRIARSLGARTTPAGFAGVLIALAVAVIAGYPAAGDLFMVKAVGSAVLIALTACYFLEWLFPKRPQPVPVRVPVRR